MSRAKDQPAGGGPDEATLAQIRAANPAGSAWVIANAGSGKTRVLIDRVALLLLGGTAPERILCLTYTKAAAAEMAERLFDRLGLWAMLDDDKLRQELERLHEDPPTLDEAMLIRARRLFAQALETPGGLKIQTIHAFCGALLRRFPLEAGVTPGFTELDAQHAALLLDEVRNDLAAAAETGDDSAFDALAALAPDRTMDTLIAAILAERGLFADAVSRDDLAAVLGVDPQSGPSDWLALATAALTQGRMRDMAAALEDGGGKHDRDVAAILRRLVSGAHPSASLADLEHAFLTKKGAPRSQAKFPVNAARALDPGLQEAVNTLTTAVIAAREARLGAAALDRAVALNRFAHAFLRGYAARKAQSGALDFEDLISHSRALLTHADARAWVLWKLDGGIDHILIDEAQDTSPAQWDVIAALAEEALSGAGARSLRRTVFAVGDMKQSIYSFQGAQPRAFIEMRDHFNSNLSALGVPLTQVPLLHSFRSAPSILRLVDAIFQGGAGAALTGGTLPSDHIAFFSDLPGRVELWPFLPRPDKPEKKPWWQPLDAPEPDDPRKRLAASIADEIARWLAEGRRVADDPKRDGQRPMRPGDILILVQRRDLLAREIVRRLKAVGVPVAGEDRIALTAVLAVRDILAVLRFLVTPSDDLSLAAALRSPLFGVSEEALFDLAHGRSGLLWQALRAAGHPAAAVLTDLRDAADFLRPHELIDRLLTRHGGRCALRARLGLEVDDAVEELTALALAHEAAEVPSLQGFLSWIDGSSAEVKRAPDLEAADLVRVMTVHGAKGLEAPVVVLPDTAPHQSPRGGPLLGAGGHGFWAASSSALPAKLVAARDRQKQEEAEERHRLLYVALTRAKSLLVVAGAGTEKGVEDAWYGMIRAGMLSEGAVAIPAPLGLDGQTLMIESRRDAVSSGPAPPLAKTAAVLPPWFTTPAPPPAPATAPLSPSALGGSHVIGDRLGSSLSAPEASHREPDDTGQTGRLLGDAIHVLLERLARIDPSQRQGAAAHFAPPGVLGQEAISAALRVLAMPEAGWIFGPDSMAEVAIRASLATLEDQQIAGRIDWLTVAASGVTAVDLKSNLRVPDTPDTVPEAILRQMGAYQAALEGVYPDRPVEVALLWTGPPRYMPLPRSLVLSALERAAGRTS